MANICSTDYVMRGPVSALNRFVEAYYEVSEYESRVADVCEELGGDPDVDDKRGRITWCEEVDTADGSLRFHVDSAWAAPTDAISMICELLGTHVNWYSEEPGCEVYEKHDDDGDFDDIAYVVDDTEEGEVYYFRTFDDVVGFFDGEISEYEAVSVKTVEDLSDMVAHVRAAEDREEVNIYEVEEI